MDLTRDMDTSLRCHLKHRPTINIFGAGLSGKGAACLCDVLKIPYAIWDEANPDPQTPDFKHSGVCVFSPSFQPQHPWWQQAQQAGALCITELDFAATCFENPVIAVTGTNGKTSVTEMVAQLLRNDGRRALSVGNNGTVLSQIVAQQPLPKDGIYVCEVSSFQASTLRFLRPTQTLWTNFAPDHLDKHGDLQHYFTAKYHLVDQTIGTVFCGHSLQATFRHFHCPTHTKSIVFAPDPQATSIDWAQYPACVSVGQHENIALVQTFAKNNQIPDAVMQATGAQFQAPTHRLHCCKRLANGTSFWNDSKGTNLHAVHAALESLKTYPNLCWILGGGDKGEPLDSFWQLFNQYSVQTIFLVGATGSLLAKNSAHFRAKTRWVGTLENVFRQLPPQPFTLVLSPGFTSWDQFASYAERGELFEQLSSRVI